MAENDELVTAFRSADFGAKKEAAWVRDALASAGIAAQVFDHSAPGVLSGAFEVRVPPGQLEQAERLIETREKLVPVFESADVDALEQANWVRDLVASAGIAAEVFDGSAPGVPSDAFQVRVPPEQREEAERAIETRKGGAPGVLDPSHDLDMVPVFIAEGAGSEMLAMGIRSILDAQGIPSVLVSSSPYPSLPFEVRVPKERIEEARKTIAEAEEAGPLAAEEAERESEAGGGAPMP
jgi:hypothetical protein